MKTKLLYTLVSTPDDVFLEQAYLSIWSAKYYMPDCHVVLVVDDITADYLDENRRKILKNVDEYIVVPLPNGETAYNRSRLIKCGVRNYVKGDFLYIDVDTIIARPLYDIDKVSASIAAIRDSHLDYSNHTAPLFHGLTEACQVMDYHVEKENFVYFNGGVLYVKDDEVAHNFYNMWLAEWKSGREKGVVRDQPALAMTNCKMGNVICQLEDIWNVQVVFGVRYMKEAKIVHYLNAGSNEHTNIYVLKSHGAFNLLKEDMDNVCNDFYMNLIKNPFLGLNEPVRVVSGNDVYVMFTWLYELISWWYMTDRKRFERVQSFLYNITKLKSRALFWRKK